MPSARTNPERCTQTFAPGNLLPYRLATRNWTDTLGAHLVRRSVSRNPVAAAQPQLVGVAERHGARMHSPGRGMQLDRDAAAGYALSGRKTQHQARAAAPGNHALPRMSQRRGGRGTGIVPGTRGSLRAGRGDIHAVFFRGA